MFICDVIQPQSVTLSSSSDKLSLYPTFKDGNPCLCRFVVVKYSFYFRIMDWSELCKMFQVYSHPALNFSSTSSLTGLLGSLVLMLHIMFSNEPLRLLRKLYWDGLCLPIKGVLKASDCIWFLRASVYYLYAVLYSLFVSFFVIFSF